MTAEKSAMNYMCKKTIRVLFQSSGIILFCVCAFHCAGAFAQDAVPASASSAVRSSGLSFSPTGRSVAVVSGNTVRVMGTDGSVIASMKGSGDQLLGAVCSPDGLKIAGYDAGGNVILWDAGGNRIFTGKIHSGAVNDLAFMPNSLSFISCSQDGAMKLTDMRGKVTSVFKGHEAAVGCVAVNADGTIIVSGSSDKTVRMWGPDGSLMRTLQAASPVLCADIRGGMIAAGSDDGKIRFWNSDGRSSGSIDLQGGPVLSLFFTADGKAVTTLAANGDIGIRTLDGKILRTFDRSSSNVGRLALSRDGRIIAAASGDRVQYWTLNWHLFEDVGSHPNDAYGAAVSADQKLIASGGADHDIMIWNFKGVFQRRFNTGGSVRSVSFSPDAKYLLSCSDDRKVILWRIDGRRVAEYDGYSYHDKSVTWSPDGSLFAFCSTDDSVAVCGLDGKLRAILPLQGRSANSAAFSPDGKMIAAGGSGIYVFSVTGKLIRKISDSHIQTLSWSPDSRMIAAGSQDVEVWDLSGRKVLSSDVHHGYGVYTVAFSPDGTCVASGTCDGQIFVIGLDGSVISHMQHSSHVHSVIFSHDGKFLATNSWDHTVKLWAVTNSSSANVDRSYYFDDYERSERNREQYSFLDCYCKKLEGSWWYLWFPLSYMGTSAGMREYFYAKNPSNNWFGSVNAVAGSAMVGGYLWMNIYESIFSDSHSSSRGFGRSALDTLIILGGSAACGFAGYYYREQISGNRGMYYGASAASVTIPFMVYTLRF